MYFVIKGCIYYIGYIWYRFLFSYGFIVIGYVYIRQIQCFINCGGCIDNYNFQLQVLFVFYNGIDIGYQLFFLLWMIYIFMCVFVSNWLVGWLNIMVWVFGCQKLFFWIFRVDSVLFFMVKWIIFR